MENFDQLKSLLSSSRRIVIITHPRPDGDAMGSSLGLHNYLMDKGHDSTVILPTEYPHYFNWMKNSRKALIYPKAKAKADDAISGAELIFLLDFNTLPRIAPLDVKVSESNATKILIDHHLSPDPFDLVFHSIKASSTSELVYDVLEALEGGEVRLNRDIAQCLYTGIVMDTGNFVNSSTTVRSFELASKLLRDGVNIAFIQDKVFNNFKEKRLRFIGNALVNRMNVLDNLGAAYITVTKEDVRTYDLDAGDTEGLVNYPLTIRGVKVAVLLKDHGDIIKLSFRSKGDVSVNEFARKYFKGGGHKNAAGGSSNKSLEQTIIDLVNFLKAESL